MESFDVDVRERDGKPSYGRSRTVFNHLKLHKSKRWFAMKNRHLGGYMIIRIKTDGKLGRRNKWGSPFGYFGYSNTFINAIRKAKKEHKVKIPVNDWVTVRCKSYHSFDSLHSHYDNIVEELKTILI